MIAYTWHWLTVHFLKIWMVLFILPISVRIAISLFIVGGILLFILYHSFSLSNTFMRSIAYLFKFTTDMIDNIDISHTKKRREKNKKPFFFFYWTSNIEAGLAAIGRGFKSVITAITRLFSRSAIRLFQFLWIICLVIAIIPHSFYLSQTFEFWHKFEGRILASQDKNLGYHYSPKQPLEKAAVVQETPIIAAPKYYLVNKVNKGVNIRETPDISGKVIGSVGRNEPLKYLNEEQTDSQGIKWYRIETKKLKIGWVSSRIVEESK